VREIGRRERSWQEEKEKLREGLSAIEKKLKKWERGDGQCATRKRNQIMGVDRGKRTRREKRKRIDGGSES
jgi:hypothetical protein